MRDDPNEIYFVEAPGESLWYRFYDLETNQPFFCDRDGIKKFSLAEISEERRNGYSWSTTAPKNLLKVYEEYGYYSENIKAVVVSDKSTTWNDKTLEKGAIKVAEGTITFGY